MMRAADRDWQLALLEALPVILREPALAEHQREIRARAQSDARALIVNGLARMEREPVLDVDLLVLQVLGVVDRILTDSLLEQTSRTYPQRAASAVDALLLHGSRPTRAAS